MTTATTCLSFGELADYWASDAPPAEIERIEAHVFECEGCARLLSEAEGLRASIEALAQSGGIQAFVTDAMLNRLARDGVRVRSYAVDPGETIRCAIWSDDEVLVTRLRADFTGVTSVDAELRLETGEQWSQMTDVPVGEGAKELVMALPASVVRNAPSASMRLTLRGSAGSGKEDLLAEYVFDHEGTLDRASRET